MNIMAFSVILERYIFEIQKYRKALSTHYGVPMTSTIGVKEHIPCFIVRTIIFNT